MQIEKNIAATLQRRMDEAGKTKLEFSRDLGIPRSTLQGYLRGEKGLRSDSIEELAKRLGMSPAQLISGAGRRRSSQPGGQMRPALWHSIRWCGRLRRRSWRPRCGAPANGPDWTRRKQETRRTARIDMRSTRRTARQECRMRMAFWASSGWMGNGKTVAMIAPFSQRQRRDCASGAALHRAAA